MQTRNRILDDLARVATGALGIAAGARREAEEVLTARFAARLGAEGFVTREEFDAVKAMAVRARSENAALAARLDALEAERDAAAATKTAAPKA
jgi:hypothetical protein